jgi:hypothetical protein
MIEKALKAKLETIPAVSNNVKVYPLTAPKGAPTPYLVYMRTSTERLPTLRSQGAHRVDFQLTIAEKSYDKMVELRSSVRSGIEFQTGVFKSGTPEVLNTIIINENEYFEPETKEYVGVIDIQLIYN